MTPATGLLFTFMLEDILKKIGRPGKSKCLRCGLVLSARGVACPRCHPRRRDGEKKPPGTVTK